MNQRVKTMLDYVINKRHHKFRQDIDPSMFADFTKELAKTGLGDMRRAVRRLQFVLELEKPVIMENEKIVFMRTVDTVPEIFTTEEWAIIGSNHYIHERGKLCNISPDYANTIKVGLWARRTEAYQGLKSVKDVEGREFLSGVIESIDAVLKLTERYAEEADRAGNKEVAETLKKVPKYGATNFREALQAFRILHFFLWTSFNYHITIGRFDQYMFPYLKKDLDVGNLDYDSAFELLEEFFLTFNRDSDLYPGMQQGDNGQSMVLGGINKAGDNSYNLLSEMCLKASLDLKLIDPKINLRINRHTSQKFMSLQQS
jgi:hypothetical protein